MSWPSPVKDDDGVTLLHAALALYKNIGMPMGPETSLRMSYVDLRKVQTRLGVEFVDATDIVRRVRMTKSPAEIDKIRIACRIASRSFANLPALIAANHTTTVTERDVIRDMTMDLLRRGADAVKYIVCKSGIDGYDSIVEGPTDTILRPGVCMVIDVGATYDGYFCDFDRNFMITDSGDSGDSAEQSAYLARHHDLLWSATELGAAAAKPGNTMHDVWKAMTDHLISGGIDAAVYATGRQGHFIGSQLTELPSMVSNEMTVLEPGMVLTLEPSLPLRDGKCIVHEECIAITTTGCEFLTERAPRQMAELAVPTSLDPSECTIVRGYPFDTTMAKETEMAIDQFVAAQSDCERFHQELGVTSTPLLRLDLLETSMGCGSIMVKDEGQRMGLKAFKCLGVSYAMSRLPISGKQTLCTMTDGNHGKGLAAMAQKMGHDAVIYVPGNMTAARVEAMEQFGATVIRVVGTYDDSIDTVRRAAETNGWILVSDTSWEGYETIPRDIMAGYGTIFREIETQYEEVVAGTPARPSDPITHVFIQAGVGGLAGAAAAWLEAFKYDSVVWASDVQLVIVEPNDADCITINITNQSNCLEPKPLVYSGGKTESEMAGLNCGIPSITAWPIIRDITNYCVVIGDQWVGPAVRAMADESIVAGESGAAGVAALMALYDTYQRDPHDLPSELRTIFSPSSRVLVINTESDTDPENYQQILRGEK
jgi:diaminopropionate ammonia-lyase family